MNNSAGLNPISVAAYSGSANILQYLKTEAKTRNNFNLATLKHLVDNNGNMLLHAAVDSGSLETVQVCLEVGCEIDARTMDQSTAVHFAATRGQLEMLQAMFCAQPERIRSALLATDVNGMSALHKSVFYDSAKVTEFLLSHGAEIDLCDLRDETPLLLAASKGSFDCARLLLRRLANVNCVDKNGRNAMHLAILNNGNFVRFIEDDYVIQVSWGKKT